MSSKFSQTMAILPLLFLISPFIPNAASARAPAPAPAKPIFQFVNDGDLNMYAGEEASTFRSVSDIDTAYGRMGVFFYNNTPNAYTLAVGVGFVPFWVWAANPNTPVRDGATLTLHKDGNLVLADADKKVVWQTNTANKGVVGIKLLATGNLVLYGAKGKFVWQSFEHPTDSLLLGQSLRSGPSDKLVSRASIKSSQQGSYAMILRPNRVSLYYKSPKSAKMLPYYTLTQTSSSTLSELKFTSAAYNGNVYELNLDYSSVDGATGATLVMSTIKYNATFAFIRLDYDGNLRIYTYYDKSPDSDGLWATDLVLFRNGNSGISNTGWVETECQLPEKCGGFGLCYKDQCVACPSPTGLLGWSETCQSPKLGVCSGGKSVKYYKMEGVEHFSSKYSKGEGPIKEDECGNKCSKDCKCLGYFYHQEKSRCWIAYDLNTLTKSGNNKHVAYIKTSN